MVVIFHRKRLKMERSFCLQVCLKLARQLGEMPLRQVAFCTESMQYPDDHEELLVSPRTPIIAEHEQYLEALEGVCQEPLRTCEKLLWTLNQHPSIKEVQVGAPKEYLEISR